MSEAVHRYRAFISYSHRDKSTVRWLHRAIETYALPRKLIGRVTTIGPVPKRIAPIFRDRDELSASSDLGSELRVALERAMFLIVVCSPASAKSKWVNEEVRTFKRIHGEGRVLALVVAGEPGISVGEQTADDESFPLALRFRLDDAGNLSNTPVMHIAADLRPNADGKRLALLKLLAGLTGLQLDELVRRETQRRMQRLTTLAAGSVGVAVLTGGLALYANAQRVEAVRQRAEADAQRRVAVQESAAAKAAADFLVSTFSPSNPGTENPRTMTALTILERSADRARTELAKQPAIQLRLLTTVARAYNNLGLLQEARTALESAMTNIRHLGAQGAVALLTLATTYKSLGMSNDAATAVRQAEQQLGPDPTQYLESRGDAAELMGRIEDDEVHPSQAIVDYDRALNLYEKAPDVEPRSIARALNNRGQVLSDLGRFADAKDSMLRANALLRKTFGDKHLLVGQSYFALAENDLNAGALPEASDYIARSVTILRGVLDDDNPILANSLSMQGQIYEAEKRPADARESLLQAIAAYKKSYKGPHYLIGIAEVYLGLVDSELGNTGTALADLDDAKRNYDASYGHLHANHGDLLVYRAMILKRANRMAEAHSNCVEGLDIFTKIGDTDSALYKADSDICRNL
jgi:tetratricopeptide (TPR) repeat protein